ncbi:hypothetical protein QBC37DRAFT_407084 [Rhypophila decipiens]|uniref:Uncharacterized protein n=1 Tax=Rhypophila decipiens TaxID=261697 RepID=A0AAN7B161_9PEZI|nr:hypothetical protein QBC37DRAFT_407084 [Rhypophila decipiens]
MSVHSVDWDEVLTKKHGPAAASSPPDTPSLPSESELSESSAADDIPDKLYESDESDVPRRSRERMPEKKLEPYEPGGSRGSISPLSSEPGSDEYEAHPALTPDKWGELFVKDSYEFDWGKPELEEDWPGWDTDPYMPTPIWRQEDIIGEMAEYRILSPLVHQADDAEDPILVKDVIYCLEEATYFVLGLIHAHKLNRFQSNVLLWKHISNVYRALYHLAVETEKYDDLVDTLVAISHIRVIYPPTGKDVEYHEEMHVSKGKLWQDLPILEVTMLNELAWVSHHFGEGEKAPEKDPRRTHLEKVITFTAQIISKLNVEGEKNQIPYLWAGKLFKAAFGRLQNWSFPKMQGFEPRPMPRPTEWVIRGAAVWMIHAASFFRRKISENEKALKERDSKGQTADAWFPPWDHGPQCYRYPGEESWVDKYSSKDFDFGEWVEWSKAKGLNEFRERSWKAWGDGFTAVLDAITKGNYEIFADGKAPSKDTEKLVRQALHAMTEAEEENTAWEQFEEDVAVISY